MTALLLALLVVAQIVGPAESAPGTLVVLAAPPAEQTAWVVAARDTVHWTAVDGDSRIVLTSPGPQLVRVVAFTASTAGNRLAVAKHEHIVAIRSGPDPAPSPPAPAPGDPLAVAVRDAWRRSVGSGRSDQARKLAAVYRDVAGEVARAAALTGPSPLKTVAGVLAETTRRNRLAVPDDPGGCVRAFFADLAALLAPRGIADPAELIPAWQAIAAGLKSAS